jgi:hypothetical protein
MADKVACLQECAVQTRYVTPKMNHIAFRESLAAAVELRRMAGGGG